MRNMISARRALLSAIAAVLAVGGIVELFDLPTALSSLGLALTLAVVAVALGIGLARGLFAPGSPNWRLPPLDTAAANSLSLSNSPFLNPIQVPSGSGLQSNRNSCAS